MNKFPNFRVIPVPDEDEDEQELLEVSQAALLGFVIAMVCGLVVLGGLLLAGNAKL